MDYLDSVVDHLADEPEPRDLKYAVLHLQAAAEVLLKARLLQEHWSLVFKDPGRADRARFQSGDFESCGTAETIARLRGIVGLELPRSAEDELKKLAAWRNALQHFGLTVPAQAVQARTAVILDFLLLFINEHLIPNLNGIDLEYANEGEFYILNRLHSLKALTKARMGRLLPALATHAERTVDCPDCGQLALVVGSTPIQCRFCGVEHHNAENFAMFYVGVGLGLEWEPGYENVADWPIRTCASCTRHALVLEAGTAAAPGEHTPLCFACGAIATTE
ncbi:hypothetical protein ACFWXO_37875 [Kitasatospora sp. NPDC059088]|uniref:hypothetical protein n=1 Tax=Kitasatospora sp. NPDC059088 TaxID=3346722 RepID=UPI00367FBC1E